MMAATSIMTAVRLGLFIEEIRGFPRRRGSYPGQRPLRVRDSRDQAGEAPITDEQTGSISLGPKETAHNAVLMRSSP